MESSIKEIKVTDFIAFTINPKEFDILDWAASPMLEYWCCAEEVYYRTSEGEDGCFYDFAMELSNNSVKIAKVKDIVEDLIHRIENQLVDMHHGEIYDLSGIIPHYAWLSDKENEERIKRTTNDNRAKISEYRKEIRTCNALAKKLRKIIEKEFSLENEKAN